MEYLDNWTDISLIKQSGWSGQASLNTTYGYVTFTATNGWRTFGWNLSNIVGKDVIFEFDYVVNSNDNSGYMFIVNLDSVDYGSSLLNLTDTRQWTHVKCRIANAKQFVGINVRGVDNTGKSVVMSVRNVRIHTDKKVLDIGKNGVIKTSIFNNIEKAEKSFFTSDSVTANDFYEI